MTYQLQIIKLDIYNFKMTLNMGYIYFSGIDVNPWKTGDELEVIPTEKP